MHAHGSTAAPEYLAEHDYLRGDYYGGFLQSFINKYYKNVSPNLPFIYHTSRCDPELKYHTTTKTQEELLLHVITALVHNGHFYSSTRSTRTEASPEVYHDIMKGRLQPDESVRENTLPESSTMMQQSGFATHAKYDPNETKIDVREKSFEPKYFLEGPLNAAKTLRENNIPFEVIGSKISGKKRQTY